MSKVELKNNSNQDHFKIYGENIVNNIKLKNVIPIDIYRIIYTYGYRPIKMKHSNYWEDKNLPFDFVICKNIGENIYYYNRFDAHINDNYNEYFLFFDHNTHNYLGKSLNLNNNGSNKYLSRFCCIFIYNNYIYEINETSNLDDNSFNINKLDNYSI